MTRKGLIVVEQMPLLLITPTSQELLFKAILVLSGPLTASPFSSAEDSRCDKTKDVGIFLVPRGGEIKS